MFDAIDAGNWASAQAGIAALPPSVLTPVAKAELYTAKGSPVGRSRVAPGADRPGARAPAGRPARGDGVSERGATDPLLIYPEKPTVNLGSAPVRYRAKPVQGEPAADQLRATLDPLIKTDDAAGRRGAAADLRAATLGRSARRGRDAGRLRLLCARARHGRAPRRGHLAPGRDRRMGVAGGLGLRDWRHGVSAIANPLRAISARSPHLPSSASFAPAASTGPRASEQACGRPQSVDAVAAGRRGRAGKLLRPGRPRDAGHGHASSPADPFVGFDPPVDQLPNVQRAVELARIGEPALAEELLRHQAKIGLPTEHHALIQLAKRLDLPAAQLWLANNGQPGARSDATDRYPNPHWSPLNGWRVDPALAFGHIVQESAFRRTAVSTAGAVGLMQVLPVTAQLVSRNRGVPYTRAALTDPKYNLEYGQSFIEMMRGDPGTAGQLPRVIASYNAGSAAGRADGRRSTTRAIRCCGSNPSLIGRRAITSPRCCGTCGSIRASTAKRPPRSKAMAEHRWPTFPTSMTRADALKRTPGREGRRARELSCPLFERKLAPAFAALRRAAAVAAAAPDRSTSPGSPNHPDRSGSPAASGGGGGGGAGAAAGIGAAPPRAS